MLSASQVAQKWGQRLQGASESIKQGVNNVTVSPTEKAAQAKDKYLQGVQQAAAEGRYEDGLRKVSLQDWQRAMTEKGVANLQNGVRAGVQNMEKFLREFLPYAQQVSDQVKAMPNVTEADAENRVLTNMRLMRQFRNSRR